MPRRKPPPLDHTPRNHRPPAERIAEARTLEQPAVDRFAKLRALTQASRSGGHSYFDGLTRGALRDEVRLILALACVGAISLSWKQIHKHLQDYFDVDRTKEAMIGWIKRTPDPAIAALREGKMEDPAAAPWIAKARAKVAEMERA